MEVEVGSGKFSTGTVSELFKIYVAQAARMRAQEGPEIGKERSLKVIDLDLPRTFPALSFFQPDGPLHLELRLVVALTSALPRGISQQGWEGMYWRRMFAIDRISVMFRACRFWLRCSCW